MKYNAYTVATNYLALVLSFNWSYIVDLFGDIICLK